MPSREFASFDVTAVVRELETRVVEGHVTNIYQPEEKTVLLKLHRAGEAASILVLEAGRRLHLTSYSVKKPSTPPAFCMGLRKYLRGARLSMIKQHEFERVVIFGFEGKEGKNELVLELFGDGNIILIGEDGRILQALVYKRMRDRNVLRGEPFKFAPSSGRNPFKISREELMGALKSLGETEIVRAVARSLGLGGVYAEEALLRVQVDKTARCDNLTTDAMSRIFEQLKGMLSQVSSGILEPCIVLKDGDPFDVVPFILKRYEGGGFELQACGSFNAALDEFYARSAMIEKASAETEVDRLRQEADRLKRVLADQERVLAEAETSAARDKSIGDMIYAHTAEIQTLLDRFSRERQNGKAWNAIVSEFMSERKKGAKSGLFLEGFDEKGLTVNICLDGLKFGLNVKKDLYGNAAVFYEKSKRAKQKMAGARKALEETRSKLADIMAEMRKAETVGQLMQERVSEELAARRVKHKEWFEKFRWFVSSDGFLIVAGKDAVSNEVLIKKHTEKSDVVFHADVVGAPFVVVKTGGKEPGERCLREAGEYAAAFSRGWREGFGNVDVYWVRPEQLSKGGSSGEFVPHGAFVVRGQRNWLRGLPLRVAVGVVSDKGNVRFVGGPVGSVVSKTEAYVVLVPGDERGKELMRHVLGVLAGKVPKELRSKVGSASVELIREFVPYAEARVSEG